MYQIENTFYIITVKTVGRRHSYLPIAYIDIISFLYNTWICQINCNIAYIFFLPIFFYVYGSPSPISYMPLGLEDSVKTNEWISAYKISRSLNPYVIF